MLALAITSVSGTTQEAQGQAVLANVRAGYKMTQVVVNPEQEFASNLYDNGGGSFGFPLQVQPIIIELEEDPNQNQGEIQAVYQPRVNILSIVPIFTNLFNGSHDNTSYQTTTQPEDAPTQQVPDAKLIIKFYDESGTFVKEEVKSISSRAASEWENLRNNLVASQTGEIEVTIVNNDTSIPVFFDNLKIQVLGDEKPLVLQENHYYPFGMNMKGIENEPENYHKFQYNGKEKEVDLGLHLYDYHARGQDPQTGRFNQIDPHADSYYTWTPYSYTANNPINMMDPDGKDPIYGKNFWGRTKLIGDDGKKAGNVYLVKGKTKRQVKKASKEGLNYQGSLQESNNVMRVPTGKVLDAVENSVIDTEQSQKENGGHSNTGDEEATRWDEGPAAQEVKDNNGNVIGAKATLSPFKINGQTQIPQNASSLAFWWHTHPKTKVGGVSLGSSNPSVADKSFQATMETRGFKGNTFVIGLRSKTVTFYNKDTALMTVKYSDFVEMGRSAVQTPSQNGVELCPHCILKF